MRYWVAETLEDILPLEDLAREALMESRFRDSVFSPEKFRRAAEKAADSARHGVLIASNDDGPVGFLYCTIGEHLVGTGVLLTSVQLFYVRPKIRNSLAGGRAANALLNGVLSWSKARKGAEVLIHVTGGIRAVEQDRFLRKRKFGVIGGSYGIEPYSNT